MHEQRPLLSGELDGAELRRWYWTKDELVMFARALGIGTSGSKQQVTDRLDGRAERKEAVQRPGAAQLTGTVTAETVIPPGQRCSQQLREFLESAIGSSSRFDGRVREFISTADGDATLGDAVEHWHPTRNQVRENGQINRFTRTWHLDNPGGSAEQLRAARRACRSLPTDARPPA